MNVIEISHDGAGGYIAQWRTADYEFLGQELLTRENVDRVITPLLKQGFAVQGNALALEELYDQDNGVSIAEIDADSAESTFLFSTCPETDYSAVDTEYRFLIDDAVFFLE